MIALSFPINSPGVTVVGNALIPPGYIYRSEAWQSLTLISPEDYAHCQALSPKQTAAYLTRLVVLTEPPDHRAMAVKRWYQSQHPEVRL